jgi:hopanoid biosynthesis associated protein HpnK
VNKAASRGATLCQVIVNADDFGLHPAVNQAVEKAFSEGVLTSTSLMVSAPAATDAIAIAHRLPELAVGLHLVLVDGSSILPKQRISALVDDEGHFGNQMVKDGVRFFLLPHVRKQLKAEIDAQFEAFRASGLKLDHVNTHKHFHLHPTLFGLILDAGKRHGMKAMRLPRTRPTPIGLKPWASLMARRLERAGIAHNDNMVGLAESGSFDESAVLKAIAGLSPGVTEMYFHPATLSGSAIAASMPNYRHSAELAALLSERVRDALEQAGARRITYASLTART